MPPSIPSDWVIAQSRRARAYKELYRIEDDVNALRLIAVAYDEAVVALPKAWTVPGTSK